MEFVLLGYGAYLTFFQFCRKAFPEITDQTVAAMTTGVDVLLFRPDMELRRLAKLAVELGIEGHFSPEAKPHHVLAALRNAGHAGETWLAALEEAREPWFHTSIGEGTYHHHRSWNDDLALPFAALTNYMAQVKAGQSIDRDIEGMRVERSRVISEHRKLLGTDADQASFDQLIQLVHTVFPYVEDHKFYCEQWFTSLFFRKIREFGAVMARYGLIKDSEDIFSLKHTEVPEALADIAAAWGADSPAVGKKHWQSVVAKRKAMMEKLRAWTAPPALGPVPKTIDDPLLEMLWGVTPEALQVWAHPAEQSDDILRGFGASPGLVEGVARVVKEASDISQVRAGEILVCPITSPSWASIFGMLKATVTDIGGTMSHAAIVAREYHLPAVVGTGYATSKIKTGQRIRVDGHTGIVTLLASNE
jgi:pyruvate,water dikinase